MERTERDVSRRESGRDHGAVMVELALVLPILVMLLVGIVQFGMAYSSQVSIQSAAREGARALALGEPIAAVNAAVNGAAGAADVTSIETTACPANPTAGSTAYATVKVKATYTFSIPFVPIDNPKTLTATARMRCGL